MNEWIEGLKKYIYIGAIMFGVGVAFLATTVICHDMIEEKHFPKCQATCEYLDLEYYDISWSDCWCVNDGLPVEVPIKRDIE